MRPADGQKRLADEAFRRLEEMIVSLRLKPGEAVTEPALVEMIEIGRTPTREAVQRLAAQGLIRVQAGKGLVITEVNPFDHLALLEARAVLERLLARRAAAVARDALRRELVDCSVSMTRRAEAGDLEGFMRQDKTFDSIIAQGARNRFASAAVAPMQTLSRRFWYAHQAGTDLEPSARLHVAVMGAIVEADPDAAGRASDALMDDLRQAAKRVLETEAAGDLVLSR